MHKNTKIVAALIAAGLFTPMAYATNGDVLIAAGSQNTALGGSGVANYVGAESAYANPAMLGLSTGSEVTGGVLFFQPKVTNTGFDASSAGATSKADNFSIPDLSYSSRISDSLSYGIAFAGVAGLGVDYSGANPQTHILAKSALSLAKVVATIAYNTQDYGVGFSPVLQYGSLALSYNNGQAYNGSNNADTSTGGGFALGGYYKVIPALTLAASYQSEIAAKYGTQISGAGAGFGLSAGSPFGAAFTDDLNQPAEVKLGAAYTFSSITLTADFKQIKWGEAKGYKDFNWSNQNVVAVGAKYAGNGYWLGLGYNSAKDPIGELPTAGNGSLYRNAAINFFNNLFFPAVVENSFTFGGGYDISKAFVIEAAAVITPEVTKKVSISDIPTSPPGAPLTFGFTTNTTTHSQQSVSLSLRYKF